MGCTEKIIDNGNVVYRDCYDGRVAQPPKADGPGTELKAILKNWLGIEANLGCSCNAMAKRMNQRGPDWVESDGMPEVLAAMRSEHAKRREKGQTILPWSDFGARQLVRLACRRARAKANP